MNKRLKLEVLYVGNRAYTYTTDPISLDDVNGLAIIAQATEVSVDPITFESSAVVANLLILPSHGLFQGVKVQFSTTGTLPSGLLQGTDYYVIAATSDAIGLAETLEDAISSNYLTITATGSGTHTLTVQPAQPPTITLEASLDGELYAEISMANNALSSKPLLIEQELSYYHFLRVTIAISAGQFNLNSKLMLRGEPI